MYGWRFKPSETSFAESRSIFCILVKYTFFIRVGQHEIYELKTQPANCAAYRENGRLETRHLEWSGPQN